MKKPCECNHLKGEHEFSIYNRKGTCIVGWVRDGYGNLEPLDKKDVIERSWIICCKCSVYREKILTFEETVDKVRLAKKRKVGKINVY
jgi:5-methylcytosine-specific restriction endonuclease McrA